MADVTVIPLPLWQLPLMIMVPSACFVLVLAMVRRMAARRSTIGEDTDWSVPPLDVAAGASLVHRWDVRCKIVTILAYSFMVASLVHLRAAGLAVCFSLAVLVISRVSLFRAAVRLMAIAGFVGMFMVVMPFSAPAGAGDTLLVFGGMDWTGFNLRGLVLAGTIAAKAVAITLLMEPLLSTAPLPVTIHGLSRLGVPEMVGQMVLLSYRYLHVFRHEAGRMSQGMGVRGFRKRTDLATLRAVANFLGMLFVRSFERTERVFDAMKARGYRGRFPDPVELRILPGDLVLAGVWLTFGILILLADRLLL